MTRPRLLDLVSHFKHFSLKNVLIRWFKHNLEGLDTTGWLDTFGRLFCLNPSQVRMIKHRAMLKPNNHGVPDHLDMLLCFHLSPRVTTFPCLDFDEFVC